MQSTLLFYSPTLVAFQKKITQLAKELLYNEMKLSVRQKTFLYKQHLYPLNFVLFEHPSRLGYFNHYLFEIGINKLYILKIEESDLLNTLRHELAHYITFILYGHTVTDHGTEYREVCSSFGWTKKVYLSRTPFHTEKPLHSDLVNKIKKLLSLSQSNNLYEAQLATEKANALLLKHHLEKESITTDDKEEFVVERVIQQNRINAKLQAISSILESFLVKPIMNHGKGIVYLELFGRQEEVEIAKYTALFLLYHLDHLWKTEKKNSTLLKGLAAKNSFFRGLAIGYKESFHKTQKEHSSSLIYMNNYLTQHIPLAYPSLKSTTVSYIHNKKAARKGVETGRVLKINKGLQNAPLLKLINFSKWSN